MLDHHIQRSIVSRLNHSHSLRFSDLKPAGIENKLFDYHLKKVISSGLAEKNADGEYSLTAEGIRLGSRLFEKYDVRSMQAEPVLFLVIRNTDGQWMIYRRKTQPLLGLAGFMHALPDSNQSILQTASDYAANVGITAKFTHRGSGYFRISSGGELESFTHFDMLVCEDASGEPSEQEDAEYFWCKDPLTVGDVLPNMEALIQLYESNESFFYEATIEL